MTKQDKCQYGRTSTGQGYACGEPCAQGSMYCAAHKAERIAQVRALGQDKNATMRQLKWRGNLSGGTGGWSRGARD